MRGYEVGGISRPGASKTTPSMTRVFRFANEEIKSAGTPCIPLISSEVTVGATTSCTNSFMKIRGLRIVGDHEYGILSRTNLRGAHPELASSLMVSRKSESSVIHSASEGDKRRWMSRTNSAM